MAECFNCAGTASGRYTVELERANTMENKHLCTECRRSLEATEWIEITPDQLTP